jgi:hypothetical protein
LYMDRTRISTEHLALSHEYYLSWSYLWASLKLESCGHIWFKLCEYNHIFCVIKRTDVKSIEKATMASVLLNNSTSYLQAGCRNPIIATRIIDFLKSRKKLFSIQGNHTVSHLCFFTRREYRINNDHLRSKKKQWSPENGIIW